MAEKWIDLTPENLPNEHLCCIIRTKSAHPGVEAKRAWLAERLQEGHVFRKLDAKQCVFIEYAPLETAWVPVEGENYFYIYCLWVQGAPRGQGCGRRLMESCLADARAQGRSGVCMLGAQKQKAWLSDQSFARKFGFQTVDTAGEYELLALSFDGSVPHFAESAKQQTVPQRGLTVFYTDQCPYTCYWVPRVQETAREHGIPFRAIHITDKETAQNVPTPVTTYALFRSGRFLTQSIQSDKKFLSLAESEARPRRSEKRKQNEKVI